MLKTVDVNIKKIEETGGVLINSYYNNNYFLLSFSTSSLIVFIA